LGSDEEGNVGAEKRRVVAHFIKT